MQQPSQRGRSWREVRTDKAESPRLRRCCLSHLEKVRSGEVVFSSQCRRAGRRLCQDRAAVVYWTLFARFWRLYCPYSA